MKLAQDLWLQLQSLKKTLLGVYAGTFLILFTLVILRMVKGIPIQVFTMDPAATMKAPFYIGIVSNFGILLWGATATVCLFSYALTRENPAAKETSLFLLFSGVFTLTLLADDQLQIHEKLVPYFLHFSENWIYATYVVAAIFYFAGFRKFILRTDYLILLLSFFFFFLSIVADFFPHTQREHYLFEDGFKLVGVVSWFTYYAVTCRRSVLKVLQR